MSFITLTTDFGADSPYVAIMRGVILSINPEVRLVDITHSVPHQDIAAGAQVLAEATRWFPPGTLHVAVIDPGVGTERGIVYLRTEKQQYLAPDNGLLSLLARRDPPRMIRALVDQQYWLQPLSATFHGRDIMAPVAARLSLGLDPEKLGPRLEQLVELQWPEAHAVPGKIEGCISAIDSFGNLITNITSEQLSQAPQGDQVRIACGDHETFGIFRTYGDQPEMTLIALVGSSGKLELAIVGDSAAIMLGEKVGAPVVVTWPDG
jgi:S-adenosyl-L-methionine hydrolase (adenosine-forming)